SAGLARVGIGLGSEVVIVEQPLIGFDEVKNSSENRVLRYLVIQPPGCREIPVVVVDAVKALALRAGTAEGIAESSCATSERECLAMRRTVAALERQARFQRSLASLGDDIDDAADRLRAVKRAAGAAEDFDALDVFRCQMSKI